MTFTVNIFWLFITRSGLFHMVWKSHNQKVEKPRPVSGKVDIVNDADITKPNLRLAGNLREWRGLTKTEK